MTPRIEVLETKVLSDNWYVLRKVTYRIQRRDGTWDVQSREAYDRGNGATILLYNKEHRTVILTRQFRLPTYVNGNASGMLIEACAGLLDDEHPEQCIAREALEETGYEVREPRKVMQAYMSPGSVTEIVHFFVAEYSHEHRVAAGGGLREEEDIEVLELPFDTALSNIASGEIQDGKTIMLLQHAALHIFQET
jgi:GDP-mannose pyrophosphatase NudK